MMTMDADDTTVVVVVAVVGVAVVVDMHLYWPQLDAENFLNSDYTDSCILENIQLIETSFVSKK